MLQGRGSIYLESELKSEDFGDSYGSPVVAVTSRDGLRLDPVITVVNRLHLKIVTAISTLPFRGIRVTVMRSPEITWPNLLFVKFLPLNLAVLRQARLRSCDSSAGSDGAYHCGTYRKESLN